MDQLEQSLYGVQERRELEPLHKYTAKTFAWMFLGLMVTFAVSLFGYATGSIRYVFMVPYAPLILLVAELGVVIFLTSRIEHMSVGMARGMFFTYAVLTGIVFSVYFLIYDLTSLVMAFASASLYFGVMALVGYTTKIDLSRIRNVLLTGLIILIVFEVLSKFVLQLAQFERVMCLLGIAVFLGYTAYDTQKIKVYHAAFGADPEMAKKASIFSALQLYLDFINLFLYILRYMGKKK